MKSPSNSGYEKAARFEMPKANGERWQWHLEALLSIRARLTEQRQRHLHEGAQDADRPGLHLGDAAADEADHDLSLGLASAEQEAIYEVDAALDRIRCGSYGICEKTQEPIPEERLRAIPWTRYCERIAEQMEPPHPHLGSLRSVHEGPPHLAATKRQMPGMAANSIESSETTGEGHGAEEEQDGHVQDAGPVG